MSYTQDRDARRARLKARGHTPGEHPRQGGWRPTCPTCADTRYIIVQANPRAHGHRTDRPAGRHPCPDCQGAA